MSRVCDLCGKGILSGNQVSHAHNISKRTWLPNLQRVNALVQGKAQNIRVCTRCLRSGKVTKHVKKARATA